MKLEILVKEETG